MANGFPMVKLSMRMVANLGSSLLMHLKRLHRSCRKYQADTLQAVMYQYKKCTVIIPPKRRFRKLATDQLQDQPQKQITAHMPGKSRICFLIEIRLKYVTA